MTFIKFACYISFFEVGPCFHVRTKLPSFKEVQNITTLIPYWYLKDDLVDCLASILLLISILNTLKNTHTCEKEVIEAIEVEEYKTTNTHIHQARNGQGWDHLQNNRMRWKNRKLCCTCSLKQKKDLQIQVECDDNDALCAAWTVEPICAKIWA